MHCATRRWARTQKKRPTLTGGAPQAALLLAAFQLNDPAHKLIAFPIQPIRLIKRHMQTAHQIRETPVDSANPIHVRHGNPGAHPIFAVLADGNDPVFVFQRTPIPVLCACCSGEQLVEVVEEVAVLHQVTGRQDTPARLMQGWLPAYATFSAPNPTHRPDVGVTPL